MDVIRNIYMNYRRVSSFYNYARLKRKSSSPPLYINIDVTNACNYRCPMCPQSNPGSSVKRGNITIELFEKIISDIKEFMPIEILCLFLAGEPLLKKDLEQYIKLVRDNLNIRPHIASNISLLTEERIPTLINAGLGSIIIDFCKDRNIFETKRKGAVWEDTYDTLKLLIKIKKEIHSIYPEIILKDISTGDADPETENERFSGLQALFSKGDIKSFQKYKFHNWGGLISEASAQDNGENVNRYHPCSHLWFNMAIQHDGRVSACCRDSEGKLIIGNAKEKSLKDIWNDEPMVRLRNALIQKEHKVIPLCSKCDRLWTGGYFGGSPVEVVKRWIKQVPGGFRFYSKK